jgi:hypothetical protein
MRLRIGISEPSSENGFQKVIVGLSKETALSGFN